MDKSVPQIPPNAQHVEHVERHHYGPPTDAPSNPPYYPTGYSNRSALPLASPPPHSGNGPHELPTVNEGVPGYAVSQHSGITRHSTGATQDKTHKKLRSALGLPEAAPITEAHDEEEHQQLLWSRIRVIMREPFAEFWGVFIMVMFGNGSVAQVLLSGPASSIYSQAPGGMGYGNYQSISWGWGLGVMLGIYVAGDSGAYLNPAITLAFCVYRGLPFRRWPVYLVAQFLGGFLAAGVVYANYIPSIDNYSGTGVRTVPPAQGATASIFCTFPQTYMSTSQQFVSELVASSLLIFVIFALKDESNMGAALGSKNWFPLSLFFLIFGIGACFGMETGYAINFARDFAPRVMAYCVGYGPEVWTAGNYYFWIPNVASVAGCLLGGFLYDFFIYTGPESPVNTPWLGLPLLLNPYKAYKDRVVVREEEKMPGGEDLAPI